jgi:hypothetical protein
MKKRFLMIAFVMVAFHGLVFAQTKTSLLLQCDQVGAQVYLNERLVGYTSPGFSALVLPGNYRVRVTKNGFPEFMTTIAVGRIPVTIVVTLSGSYYPGEAHLPPPSAFPPSMTPTPRFVDYEIKIPEYFITRWKKPAQFRDLEIYLDGKRLQSAFGKTTPGTHRLALVSKDLRLENDFEVAPGRFASIELFLGINIH